MSAELCVVCERQGRKSRLSMYQINLQEAFKMCPVPQCTYPFGDKETMNKGIVKRSASEITCKKRKQLSINGIQREFQLNGVKRKSQVNGVKRESLVTGVKRESPVSSVKRESLVNAVKIESLVNGVKRESPVSSVQGKVPVNSVKGELQNSSIGVNKQHTFHNIRKPSILQQITIDKSRPNLPQYTANLFSNPQANADIFDSPQLQFPTNAIHEKLSPFVQLQPNNASKEPCLVPTTNSAKNVYPPTQILSNHPAIALSPKAQTFTQETQKTTLQLRHGTNNSVQCKADIETTKNSPVFAPNTPVSDTTKLTNASHLKSESEEFLLNNKMLPDSCELKAARLKAERFLQWQNVDNLCWLDVALCLLVHCASVAGVSAQLSKCMLKDVLLTYKEANDNLKRAIEFKKCQLMCKTASEVYLETSVGSVVVRTGGGDVTGTACSQINGGGDALSTGNGHRIGNGDVTGSADLVLGAKTRAVLSELAYKASPLRGDTVPRNHVKDDVLTLTTQDLAQKCAELAEIGCEKMMGAREKVWDEINRSLGCMRGQTHSPLFVLPLLMEQHQLLVDHFTLEFEWQMNCGACRHQHCDSHEKTVATFPGVPSDFTMEKPHFVRDCPNCGAGNQLMNMVYKRLPPVLLVHFAEGLHQDLGAYNFTVDGASYQVSGVIQALVNPSHFVAWIRNVPLDLWMMCDDLSVPVCYYDNQAPTFQPSEVHIMMWERQPCPSGYAVRGNPAQGAVPTVQRSTSPITAPNGSIQNCSNSIEKVNVQQLASDSVAPSHENGYNCSISNQKGLNPSDAIDNNDNKSTIYTVIKPPVHTSGTLTLPVTSHVISNGCLDNISHSARPKKSCLSPRKHTPNKKCIKPKRTNRNSSVDLSDIFQSTKVPIVQNSAQKLSKEAVKKSSTTQLNGSMCKTPVSSRNFKADTKPSIVVKSEQNGIQCKGLQGITSAKPGNVGFLNNAPSIDSKLRTIFGKRKISEYTNKLMPLWKRSKSANAPVFQGYIPKSEKMSPESDNNTAGCQAAARSVNFAVVVKVEKCEKLARGGNEKTLKHKAKKLKLEKHDTPGFVSLDNPDIVSIQKMEHQPMKMQDTKHQPIERLDTKTFQNFTSESSDNGSSVNGIKGDEQVDEFCETLNNLIDNLDTTIDDIDIDFETLLGPDK